MSGPYKYRCLGRNASGDRCKRRCTEAYSYCAIHSSQGTRQESELLEAERINSIEVFTYFKDGDTSERACGHCCALNLDKCCICIDTRAAERVENACIMCKPRYAELLPPPPPPPPLQRIEFRNAVVFEFDAGRLDADGIELLNQLVDDIRRLRDLRENGP
jgi:hypothetical protein